MPIFGKKKEREKEKKKAGEAPGRKPPSPDSPQHYGGGRSGHGGRSNVSLKSSPSSSMQNLTTASSRPGVGGRRDREAGGTSVKDKVSRYEQATEKTRGVSASYTSLTSRDRSVTSPPPSSSATASQHGSNASLLRPDVRSQTGSSYSSVASPASDQVTINVPTTSGSSPYRQPNSYGLESPPAVTTEEDSRSNKPGDAQDLPLPPLQMATVRHRSVVAEKSPANGGGFGFILRQSYLPVPEDPGQTRLVHLVEPRPDYMGPLMTGDRITQVNGEDVEDEPHERVVELIKASGDRVELMVASMPELLELNARVFHGSDNPFKDRSNKIRKSARMKPGQTGTLRKQAAKAKEFKVSCSCLYIVCSMEEHSGGICCTHLSSLHLCET